MESKWVVVVIEQECEDISVYDCLSLEDANRRLKEIWEHDIAVEVEESTRRVDFAKSTCNEGYAELYYLGEGVPIRYSVEEIVKHKKNKAIADIIVRIGKVEYKAGDVVPKVKDYENARLVVISHRDGYIVINTSTEGLVQIPMSEI